MIKEQTLIIKVQYDDSYDQTPHTWNWAELLGSDLEIEVLNHGAPEKSKEIGNKAY